MSFSNQVLVIVLSFFVSFIYIRGFLYGVKRYQLNNSAYKKRKKGETFKEWLLYSRFQEEIPKILLVLYYFVLLIHTCFLIVCSILCFTKYSYDVGGVLARIIAIFDAAWIIIIALLFWSSKPEPAYGRWIKKRRGQQKNKK